MTLRTFWNLLRTILGRDLRTFIIWTAVVAGVYFINLVPPYLVGKVVDFLSAFKASDSPTPLFYYCLGLTGLMITTSMVRIHAKELLCALSIVAGYRARVFGFERLMNRSLSWHESENTGSKVQKISTGSLSLQEFLRIGHSDLLLVIVSFVGVVTSFFYAEWILGAIGIVYLTSFFTVLTYFYRKVTTVVEDSKRAAESASGVYIEGASNIVTIKTLNLEKNVTTKVVTREAAARDLKVRVNRYIHLKWRFLQVINGCAMGAFVYFVGWSVMSGTTSPGALVALFTYFRTMTEAAGDSSGFLDVMIDHWASIGRMAPLFKDSGLNSLGSEPFPNNWKSIELTSVVAPYANDKGGLDDISLTIKRGEHVGIVGPSGAGKSSLAKVLMGVLPIQSGSYKIGDTPFQKISSNERANSMSIVLQDSELFNMSLSDNITVMRDIPLERLAHAISTAHLTTVVEKLTEGLDTLIGEKGYKLSGGERQRLGIARAICKHPQILVLDEATSALDGETEQHIHEGLRTMFSGHTLIIIAHRLSTLKHVDRILVIDNGTIVEEGSPNDLLRNRESRFSKMWEKQMHEAQ